VAHEPAALGVDAAASRRKVNDVLSLELDELSQQEQQQKGISTSPTGIVLPVVTFLGALVSARLISS